MSRLLALFFTLSGWLSSGPPSLGSHNDLRAVLIEEEDDDDDDWQASDHPKATPPSWRQETLQQNNEYYDAGSRCLHWLMALGMGWQFLSAAAHAFLEDTAIEAFLWASHKPMGVVLMLAIVMRIVWALMHRSRRPASLGGLVSLGHAALYLLMLAVPLVALIRQYGAGRELVVLGMTLMPGFEGDKIGWMTALGNAWHGLLGWLLLALIVGHVAAVIRHQAGGERHVLNRMLGPDRSREP